MKMVVNYRKKGGKRPLAVVVGKMKNPLILKNFTFFDLELYPFENEAFESLSSFGCVFSVCLSMPARRSIPH